MTWRNVTLNWRSHLITPFEIRVLGESEVTKFSLEQLVYLFRHDALEQNVEVRKVVERNLIV